MHHLHDALTLGSSRLELFATGLNRQRTNGEVHRGRPSHVLANRLSLHLRSSKLERHRPILFKQGTFRWAAGPEELANHWQVDWICVLRNE
jgi:hypothetical protein